jgi:pseudo-rSAM protein
MLPIPFPITIPPANERPSPGKDPNGAIIMPAVDNAFPVASIDVLTYLNKILQYIPKEKLIIHCLIEKISDIETFDTELSKQSVKYVLFPIYNGSNDIFFKDNVFITQSDIDTTFLDMNQVFKNQTLNNFFFGHLILLPNGNVHTNLNTEEIGNIFHDTLVEMVYKMLDFNTFFVSSKRLIYVCSHLF